MRFEELSDDDIRIRLWASGRLSKKKLYLLFHTSSAGSCLTSEIVAQHEALGLTKAELEDAVAIGDKSIFAGRRRFGDSIRFGFYSNSPSDFRPVSWVGELPDVPVLSVVGTRGVSEDNARRLHEWIKRHLADVNGIVSGGAKGVDAIAHEVALELSRPTWIVFAGGVLNPTPQSSRLMFERVLERGGGWISENPPNAFPREYDFIERNKLIASISCAVLVARAPARSGALSTARSAMKMGKPVVYLGWDFDDEGAEGASFLASKGCLAVYSRAGLMKIIPSAFASGSLQLPLNEQVQSGLVQAGRVADLRGSLREAWTAFLAWSSGESEQMGDSPSAHAEYLLDLELAGFVRTLPGGDCALTELGLRMRNAQL